MSSLFDPRCCWRWPKMRCHMRRRPASRLIGFVVSLVVGCLFLVWISRTIENPILRTGRCARFGRDGHCSILRLAEPEVQVVAVSLSKSTNIRSRTETTGVFVVVDAEILREAASAGKDKRQKWLSLAAPLECSSSFRYDIYLTVVYRKASSCAEPDGSTPTSQVNDSSPISASGCTTSGPSASLTTAVERAAARRLQRRCMRTAAASELRKTAVHVPPVDVWIVRLHLINGSATSRESPNSFGDSHVTSKTSLAADLVTEAYFMNVTWYEVIFIERTAADVSRSRPQRSESRSTLRPRRSESSVSTIGNEGSNNVGAEVDWFRVAHMQVTSSHVRFHRTHVEIMGRSWPVDVSAVDDVIAYLSAVYSDDALDDRAVCSSLQDAIISGRQLLTRYVAALQASTDHCLRCYLHQRQRLSNADAVETGGRNEQHRQSIANRVISMVLYGDDPRYTIGAVRNGQLLPFIFPGWRLRIYVQAEPELSVPGSVLERLIDLGVELVQVDVDNPSSATYRLAPMLWRFLVIDDTSVDVFLSRDSDSRLTERDAAAVSAWIGRRKTPSFDASAPSTLFHCIRDHPSHGNYPVNGGMWGARRRELAAVLGLRSGSVADERVSGDASEATRTPITIEKLLLRYGDKYMDDMQFMEHEIWSRLTNAATPSFNLSSPNDLIMCHDSVTCDRWPGSMAFSIYRRGNEHVGQVFDGRGLARAGDEALLAAAERNVNCEPDRRPASLISSNDDIFVNISCKS